MTTIEFHLNGKKQCSASCADGTVDVHIFCGGARSRHKNPSPGYTGFLVSGLDSVRDEHLEWTEGELAPGDELQLRILETAGSDPPKKRTPSEGDRAAKEFMVRRLAKELGWTIRTK